MLNIHRITNRYLTSYYQTVRCQSFYTSTSINHSDTINNNHNNNSNHNKINDNYSSSHNNSSHQLNNKLITTPIFYVNGTPHIGHLYTSVLGDAIARWNRFCNDKVLYMTGTDEHGQKVQDAAKKAQKDNIVYCDEISGVFRKSFDQFGISYDDYIRTTEQRHKNVVHDMWNKLDGNGLIYKGSYEGWYCVSDEAFLTNDQVQDGMSPVTPQNPVSKPCKLSIESGNPCEWVSESNYMFKLTDFLKPIDNWLSKNPLYPESWNLQARSYLPHLKDLSVSRPSSRLPWGIRVPNDESQSIYVWLDALTNYLTVAGGFKARSADGTDIAWNHTDVTHVIGKDILKFHSIYWPAFLLGTGLKLPHSIVTHAHWTVERVKMSKSRGNVISPFDIAEKYGIEGVRYFLLKGGGLENDGDWSDLEVRSRITADLADTFGNLVTRCTAKALHPSRAWPTCLSQTFAATAQEPNSLRIIEQMQQLVSLVNQHYKCGDIKSGIYEVINFTYATNNFVEQTKPWTLVPKPGKQAGDLMRLNDIMYILLECIRTIALLLSPVIPESSKKTLDHIGVDETHRNINHIQFGYDYPQTLVPMNPLILFKKE
ncbi:methionyl-tRNA synthetase [Heterostelium album PN500]|uniref:methionine--tRNA ligase n=1 Tax=Heterostelium pallidum (strain ATCC 26659 / Pp 5 / PN500) TaxID=670386 RepID=D3B9T8_HETP5|nr:methionyl-tRNA synthetase [Heterostelium album PN500]EFA82000.1 methionyl-tRNA synthetase [Heterostelium album PN500]|eukprot:XP_020434117.1 methionyl-tRNA synthetase [Heterostelium album PN500]